MSTGRTLWILGVLAVTFLATLVGFGKPVAGDDGPLVMFFVVVASWLPLLVVHELGHALASVLVGYKVTSIKITAGLDGLTEWEAPPGRASTGRSTIALAGGPVVTLAVAAVLLLPGHLSGLVGSWRAGLGAFAVLWTLDLLAPLPRAGIARDGWAMAQEWKGRRAERGDHGPAMNAVIASADGLLLAGDGVRAYESCMRTFDAQATTMPPMAWAALAGRLGLACLLVGREDFVAQAAVTMEAAAGYAPQDPVVTGVRAAVAAALGRELPAAAEQRQPVGHEAALIAMAAEERRTTRPGPVSAT